MSAKRTTFHVPEADSVAANDVWAAVPTKGRVLRVASSITTASVTIGARKAHSNTWAEDA